MVALENAMAEIFISYERSDRAHAERIAAALEHQGWSVWWDRKLFGGESFGQTIQQALTDARCVIVLWSTTSVASSWVKDEATEGAGRGILVPVLIDAVDIPLGFRQIHAIRLSERPTGEGSSEFADLIESVGHLLRGPSSVSRTATESVPQLSADPVTSAPDRRRDSNIGPERPVASRTRMIVSVVAVLAVLGSAAALRQCAFTSQSDTAGGARENSAGGQGSPSAATPPNAAPATAEKPHDVTQSAAFQVAGIVVAGTGQDLYYVFDASDQQQLATAFTNKPIELFPGNYTVVVNGVRQPVIVDAKRQTIVDAGRVVVAGIGQDLYYVFDAAGGKQLATAFTNRAIELLPGSYTVVLNNVRQKTTVAAKRQTTVDAGRIVVPGTGSDLYYVHDSTGEKQLATAFTNREIELFPGSYVVVLNQIRRPAQVVAKTKVSIDR
jgi:hypothetical protein